MILTVNGCGQSLRNGHILIVLMIRLAGIAAHGGAVEGTPRIPAVKEVVPARFDINTATKITINRQLSIESCKIS